MVSQTQKIVNQFSNKIRPIQSTDMFAQKGWHEQYDVPKGFIGMWGGTIASIPRGWAFCNGSNGTLDMRGRFPKSIDTTESPGTAGGATTHSHTFINNTGIPGGGGSGYINAGGASVCYETHIHCVPSTDVADSFPPYREVIFIMKT